MRRADRLFQILQYLRGGRLLTARALAERLEVSTRTVYRDIADLQSTGVPIDGEAGVGYVMQQGFDLPPLMFDEDEIVALVAGARLIKAWGGATMALAAEEALTKIETVLPASARARAQAVQVHSIGWGMEQAVRERLDRIETAIQRQRQIKIAYRDETGQQTKRILRPLGLWFWAPGWTLVAWCTLREGFRMFRVDRIETLEEGETFRPEQGKTLRDFYASPDARRPKTPPAAG